MHGSLKSRYVAAAFRDKGAIGIATRSPTITKGSQRLAFAMAARALKSGRKIFTRDVSQAYTQSKHTL